MRSISPFVAMAVVLVTARARAQELDGDESARELFELAVEAGARGRLGAARDLFRESFALEPRAQTAYNLALVQRELGELTDAEALLAESRTEDATPDLQAALGELLEQIRSEIARLSVSLRGDHDGAELRIDGVLVEGVGSRRSARLDPGRHVVVARADDGRQDEVTVDLERGESRDVTLDLGARVPSAPVEPTDGTSPWPFLGIGAGVVIAAAITVAIILTLPALTEDPVWGRGEALAHW